MSTTLKVLLGLAVMALIVYYVLNHEEIEKTAKILRKVQEREKAQQPEPEEAAV